MESVFVFKANEKTGTIPDVKPQVMSYFDLVVQS